MEDIQAYIESGILELYAAGDLSPAEKRDVEAMISRHPELKAELAEIEQGLEEYAAAYAIAPSVNLRRQVIDSLLSAEENPEEPEALNDSVAEIRSAPSYKYAFAACLTLLLVSLGALFVLYSRLQQSNQQIAVLQAGNQQFSNRVNNMDQQLKQHQHALSVLRNPQVKLIKLSGTKQSPESSMMLAFNPASKEVMIDMSAMKVPANDAGHQYQLWAMVKGKPVDLGVFDMKADDQGMKKMKAIAEAEAFAVTLEPRGGSLNPSMEHMMLLGVI